jgi:hypothetical protein
MLGLVALIDLGEVLALGGAGVEERFERLINTFPT